jgi:hypothetical protein
MQGEVKTSRPRLPYEQPSEAEFKRVCRLFRGSADAKYTYFMRNRRNGLIKIGMSNDPERRRATLSASGARDMEILLTLRDWCLEGCYHQHFADLRVEGEWFEPHPDIFAEIARLNSGDSQ